jgi:hypothetical protein
MDHRKMTRSDKNGEAKDHAKERARGKAKVKHEAGVRTARANDDLTKAPGIVDPRSESEGGLG